MKKNDMILVLYLFVLFIPVTLFAQGKDYLIKGKNLLITNDYERAKSSFRDALDLGVSTSDSAVCFFGIAICSVKQNDIAVAKTYIRRALEISPSFNPEISGIKDFADQNILKIFDEIKREILGKVYIESEPLGLDIYFDGLPIGKTPKQIDNVLVGKHTIKVAGQTKEIIVESDRTNRVSFTLKKPENVRNTKSYGIAIDNSALLALSYRNWLTDFSTFNINLGVRGLASPNLLFVFSIGYLRHIFPDYDAPRNIVWGGEIDWNAISITGEGTNKEFNVRNNIVFSFVIGSEYFFKRTPLSINTMVHIRLARFDAELDPIFDTSFYPIFSCEINLFK